MKIAKESEAIIDAACRFRAADDLVELLKETPKAAEEELKAEGDVLYG